MTQKDFDAIDEWDDIIEEAEPVSEVETGSELDEAIRRKSIADRELGVVPPHGPRAYRRSQPSKAASDVRDVPVDEVLFDDASDWRAQPTMRIVVQPNAAITPPTDLMGGGEEELPSSSMRVLIGACVAAVLAVGAVIYLANEREKEARRVEQEIRTLLETSE